METEVPCWSGFWFETEGHGYLEISDTDERPHQPPAGWKLDSVSHNLTNSSQIFRYVPVDAVQRCEIPLEAQA